MSAVSPSLYENITLNKNGSSVYIDLKTISFDYFESLFSPIVTANIAIVDTEGISSSLPIEGNETVGFAIKSKLGRLDFLSKPLHINSSPVIAKEANRESIAMSLISTNSIQNLKTTISKKYSGLISSSVNDLLTKQITLNTQVYVDPTENHYNFLGSSRSVFEIILGLCQKAIPSGADGMPGYFLYEDQRGVNFKGISNLLKQTVYPQVYTYNSVLKSDENNDFRILSYNPIRNQTILNALKTGVYSTRNIFFDPRTLEYKEVICKINNDGTIDNGESKSKKINYLGGKLKASNILTEDFSRTHFHVLDVGMLENESTKLNNSPKNWQALASFRYNVLFSKMVNIVIPCNPNLLAGQLIEIRIQKTSTSNIKEYDEAESGKYLILNLCHHFDTTKSYTSLTLIKDTPGF